MHLTRLQQQNCSSPNSQPAFQIQALLGTSLEEAELQILKQIGIKRERERHTHTHAQAHKKHTPLTITTDSTALHACMCVCVCERERERECTRDLVYNNLVARLPFGSSQSCRGMSTAMLIVAATGLFYTQVSQGGGGDSILP
jgi:hypothetical protein